MAEYVCHNSAPPPYPKPALFFYTIKNSVLVAILFIINNSTSIIEYYLHENF
jgi:hypothetical protein